MLKSIYIDNYALIERLEIELHGGLSIITGETGAGKSILLGALGLLLGKRADTAVLKEPDKKCVVEGIFSVKEYGLENFFKNNDLDYQEEAIIRREISNTGKSRAFINDSPVNLDVLQQLAVSLIDIHSQNQNLSLNSESYIRWIIDTYAGLTGRVQEYAALYREYTYLKKKVNQAHDNFIRDRQNVDFLTHQYKELTDAKLLPGELSALEEESMMLNHAEEIKSSLENCLNLLSDDEHGVLKELKAVNESLSRIKTHFPKVLEILERSDTSLIELKDINAEIELLFSKIDFDPSRHNVVNQRMDQLQGLLHKNKISTIDELIEIRDKLGAQVLQIESGDFTLEEMQKALTNSEAEIKKQAAVLSSERNKVFPVFESKVQELLQSLGMKNARFLIQNESTEPNETGIDRIQFLFSANANISPQNISKVASGGELSRLMLAVKYHISKAAGLPTIVFDEIDTGVSGEIADKVGRLIKEMAIGMQVINITHLPQVASKGNHHFMVYKESINGTSKTKIRRLSDKERLNEIARMLSGDSITPAAIENARVLLGF